MCDKTCIICGDCYLPPSLLNVADKQENLLHDEDCKYVVSLWLTTDEKDTSLYPPISSYLGIFTAFLQLGRLAAWRF